MEPLINLMKQPTEFLMRFIAVIVTFYTSILICNKMADYNIIDHFTSFKDIMNYFTTTDGIFYFLGFLMIYGFTHLFLSWIVLSIFQRCVLPLVVFTIFLIPNIIIFIAKKIEKITKPEWKRFWSYLGYNESIFYPVTLFYKEKGGKIIKSKNYSLKMYLIKDIKSDDSKLYSISNSLSIIVMSCVICFYLYEINYIVKTYQHYLFLIFAVSIILSNVIIDLWIKNIDIIDEQINEIDKNFETQKVKENATTPI